MVAAASPASVAPTMVAVNAAAGAVAAVAAAHCRLHSSSIGHSPFIVVHVHFPALVLVLCVHSPAPSSPVSETLLAYI